MDNPTVASKWRRVIGGIIDLVVLFIFCVAFSMVLGVGEVDMTNRGASVSLDGWPFVVALALYAILFALMEYKTGKTPGKFFVNTHVVSEDYQPISFWQALMRNLGRFVDVIGVYLVGFIIMLCSKENQRFGDLIGKTIVVND